MNRLGFLSILSLLLIAGAAAALEPGGPLPSASRIPGATLVNDGNIFLPIVSGGFQ